MIAWLLAVVVLDHHACPCHKASTDFRLVVLRTARLALSALRSSCVRSVDRASDHSRGKSRCLSLRSLRLPWRLLLQVGGSNELIAGKRRVVTNEMAMSADYHQVRSSLAGKSRLESGRELSQLVSSGGDRAQGFGEPLRHRRRDLRPRALGAAGGRHDGAERYLPRHAIRKRMLLRMCLKALLLLVLQEPRSSQARLLESDRSPAVEQAIEHGPTPCSGQGIQPGKCNCAGDEPDICGICGGSSVPSVDPRIRGQPVLNLESCDCVGHGARASHSLHTTFWLLI